MQKLADIRRDVSEVPRALGATLERGRSDYDALVRRVRWGEGPIHVVGRGPSYYVGLTGAYAFEFLLGWPVVLRSPRVFKAYAQSVLRPRSIVLAISASGESEETVEAARLAHVRGAILLALTAQPKSTLAQMADGVFVVEAGGGVEGGLKRAVCQQAALSYLAWAAARALTRPTPLLEVVEKEWQELPLHAEWVLQQLDDAARSLAVELTAVRQISAAGGGFYHPPCWQWSLALRESAAVHLTVLDPADFLGSLRARVSEEHGVVFLSGSRCRLKTDLHHLVASAAGTRAKVFSITDRDDRRLVDRSLMTILLPVLTEIVGSILALLLLACVTYHIARELERAADRTARRS